MKKILAFILVLILALSTVSFSAFADSLSGCEIVYDDFKIMTTGDGECTITGYLGNETEIFIPKDFEGTIVTAIGKGAFEKKLNISYVNIPKGVTSIGERAFAFCKNLSYVEIPNSVTHIEKEAFLYCTGMSYIDVPDSVTSIGEKAIGFNCRTLNTETCIYEYQANSEFAFNCSEGTVAYDYYKEHGFRNGYPIEEEKFMEFVFRVPKEWKDYNKIYCQINELGSDARTFTLWQSKSTECRVNVDNTILWSTSAIKGYEEGTVYEVVFSTDTGEQTYPAIFTKECSYDVLYTYGTYAVTSEEMNHRLVTKWENSDQSIYENAFRYWDNTYLYTVTPDEATPDETTKDESTYDEALPWGDADCNGKVNVKDATAIQKHVADITTLTASGVILSNFINKDTALTVRNATEIQKYCAGLRTFVIIGKPATTRVAVEMPLAWEGKNMYALSWSDPDNVTILPYLEKSYFLIPIYNNNIAITCNGETTQTWTLDFYSKDRDGYSDYNLEAFSDPDGTFMFIWTSWD